MSEPTRTVMIVDDDPQILRLLRAMLGPQNVNVLSAPRPSDALPKTRSGKIMRRLLKEIAAGGAVKGDTTTLEDLSVIAALSQSDE